MLKVSDDKGKDVPLIFENSLQGLFSHVILVYVPEEVQVERLVSGRGFTPERARSVIDAQMPIEAKRGRHSQKPACVYELLERMYPRASKLELFARGRPRVGWSAWGNEVPS